MSYPSALPAPLYQGSANAWECDEGGHLNIRFHVERAMIGLAHLAHALEMRGAFTASAGATLVPLDLHMRFLKEARPPAPLIMHGGIIDFSEAELVACLDMRHGDGAPASAFTVLAAHADPRSLKAFPWSTRTRAAAKTLHATLPAHAAPRSIDPARTPPQASRARALALGATRIGASSVAPDQCDAFGRLRCEHFVGRVSDSVANFLKQWREALAAEAAARNVEANPAGAVLEGRLSVQTWPRAGDLVEIYSAIVEIGEKTLRLGHWIVDPESGEAWATLEVIAVTFDTHTRKMMTPSETLRATMRTLPELLD